MTKLRCKELLPTMQHFALGGEVEWLSLHGWELTKSPAWEINVEYRPKPKEVYEWQWYRIKPTGTFYTEQEMKENSDNKWVKLESSKRIRK